MDALSEAYRVLKEKTAHGSNKWKVVLVVGLILLGAFLLFRYLMRTNVDKRRMRDLYIPRKPSRFI